MTRLHRRALAYLVTTLLFVGQASPSFAQAAGAGVDDETRATARVVAQEGLDFYDKGLYKEALDRLERANALVSAPTLGLMIGRCLEKLGRLVEASERYLDVTRTKVDAKSPDLFRKAVTDATRERDELLPRIPSIAVEVEGSGDVEPQVMLDNKPIPAAMLGLKRLINPGIHRVEVTRGDEKASEDFVLKEGELREVKLVPKRPEGVGDVKPPTSRSGIPPQKVASIVLMGLGAAGVVTGAVTGGMAAGQLSDLERGGCKNGHCYKSQFQDVSSYNTLRLVSAVGLYAGAGLAAGGVVLFLTSPKSGSKAKPSTGSVEPFLGPGSAGLRGTF